MRSFRDEMEVLLGSMCPSQEQCDAMEAHYSLMLRWNKVLNLTRITEFQDAVRRHYAESVFLAHQLPVGSLRIGDFGSGAGFPGIVVAILRPECEITLIESHGRKAAFLKEAARSLTNVKVVCARGESLPQNSFDWIVSRAVTAEHVLAARLSPHTALFQTASLGEARSLPLPWDSGSTVSLFSNV